jgi:predicted nucleotide-binding protein (sugar kinase/HSP70/actin superfamily)
MPRIGIPKSLFYYYHYILWSTFFKNLDFEVITSKDTNKKILDDGIKHTVDEVCLPVKVFFGHVIDLRDKVDYVFVPRIISVEQKTFVCPKFMGLPDMIIAAGILHKDKLLSPTINIRTNKKSYMQEFVRLAKRFVSSNKKIKNAWDEAVKNQKKFENLCILGYLPEDAILKIDNESEILPDKRMDCIAVLGHGYNIYDRYTSMDIIKKISQRYRVVTADMLSSELIEENVSYLSKKMFWSLGKRMFGGVNKFINDKNIKGMIYLASFGCGPDSLVGDLSERRVNKKNKKPFMLLNIDEHSGQVGMTTRLEAFLDMIDRSRVV